MGTDNPPNPPSTPKSKQLIIVGETPIKTSQTSLQQRKEVGLEKCRLAVVDDLGHSLEQVPLPYFEDYVFPPLPDGLDIDAVIKELHRTKALCETLTFKSGTVTRQMRWAAFPSNFPEGNQHEDAAFSRLIGVVGAIISAASTVCDSFHPRMEYKSRPREDMLMVYDKESGSSKPDGYFVHSGLPERRKKRSYWHEVVVPGEYKISDSDQSDIIKNRQQTCWNLYQQLRQDPRRRFALAFTIEKTATRFWFCNRSRAFVSKPFDFLREGYVTFIRFILRVVAAEDHELGWDTTMVQRPLDTIDTPITPSNLMYDMEVHGEGGGTYRTVELLSDIGARLVKGRGTRVWKAKKVGRNEDDDEFYGPEVALKDAWVDADRAREAQILETLKLSGKGKGFELIVKDHLLTVECYGDVLINGVADHTLELHTSGHHIPLTSRGTTFPLVSAAMPNDGKLSGINTVSSAERKRLESFKQEELSSLNKETSQTQEKQHQRTVFAEVADSLHSCNEPSEVFHALGQIVIALKQIHQAGNGWVHRDISAGNILIASDGIAKLADLEYMKELTDLNAHEVRTGTAYFIACEADRRKYLYAGKTKGKDVAADERPTKRTRLQDTADSQHKSPEEVEQEDEDEYLQAVAKARGRRRATQSKAKVVSVPANRNLVFFHNALHDLESILWIAIYFLFDKEPISHLPETSAQAASEGNTPKIWTHKKQLEVAAALFYNKYARVNAMAPHVDWQEYVDVLHPACQPAAMLIGEMRQLLIEKYTQVESRLPMDIRRSDIGGSLYLDFGRMLQEAADSLEGVVVKDLSRVVLV